jgi:arsenate reductase-like glutaredoxin family protein
MRNRVNHELLQIQKSLFGEILRLQEELENVSSKGPSPAKLKDIINRMNVSVESLQATGVETQELGEEIRQNS